MRGPGGFVLGTPGTWPNTQQTLGNLGTLGTLGTLGALGTLATLGTLGNPGTLGTLGDLGTLETLETPGPEEHGPTPNAEVVNSRNRRRWLAKERYEPYEP